MRITCFRDWAKNRNITLLQSSQRITTSALDFCSYPYICSLSQDLVSALDLNSALDSSCYSYNWFLFWDSQIALDFASASDFRSHSYVYSLSPDFGFVLDFYSYICSFSQDWGSAFLCQFPHGSASLRKILKCTALVRLRWGTLREKNWHILGHNLHLKFQKRQQKSFRLTPVLVRY